MALARIGKANSGKYAAWQMTAVAGLLDALARRDAAWQKYDTAGELAKHVAICARHGRQQRERRGRTPAGAFACWVAAKPSAAATSQALVALLVPQSSGAVQAAAVEALRGSTIRACPRRSLAGWKSHGPALRSEILDALLSRDRWAGRVARRRRDTNQCPPATSTPRAGSGWPAADDEAIKQRAAKLLAGDIESNRHRSSSSTRRC